MVECIEYICAELQELLSKGREVFRERQVRVRVTRADQIVAAFVAEFVRSGLHKTRGVEPVTNGGMFQLRITYLVGARRMRTASIGVVRCRNIKRKSSVHREDAAQVPAWGCAPGWYGAGLWPLWGCGLVGG